MRAEQAGADSQRTAKPAFRSDVDLVVVEATAVERDGAIARGLTPRDFRVEINGRSREVVSADLVEYQDATVQAAEDEDVATNEAGPAGRTILLVVDQSSLRVENRGVLAGAKRWVGALPAGDRIGFLALPAPGPVVEFTTAHEQVIDAFDRLSTGVRPSPPPNVNRKVSLWEAFQIMEKDDAVRAEVVARECPPRESRCPTEIGENARALVMESDTRVRPVLSALRGVLKSLGAVPGQKHVVLVSSGWPIQARDVPAQIAPLAEDAAAADATIHVFTAEDAQAAAAVLRVSPRATQDADLLLSGVESLASSTGGRAVRLAGSGEAPLQALTNALSGFYRLAVRPAPEDLDGRSKRISVDVTRAGVSLIGYRSVMAGVRPGSREPRPTADTTAIVRDVVRSPGPARELGLKATSYVLQGESAPESLRVLVTAEVSRAAQGAASAIAVLFGPDGKSAAGSEQTVTVSAGGRARFSTFLEVPPGAFVLRLAVADLEGRAGSLDLDVYATWQRSGEVSTTGLVLFRVAGGPGGVLEPLLDVVAIEDSLIAQLPLAASPREDGRVTFEVTRHGDHAPVRRLEARVGRSSSGAVVAEASAAPGTLAAGQYSIEASVAGVPVSRRAFRVE